MAGAANLGAAVRVLPHVSAPDDFPARSEEELLHAVARGDRSAFAELYDRTAPWLAARLRRRVGTSGDSAGRVEEILQDTFLTVWRAASGYAGSGAAVGWIWTIARNRMVEVARRDRIRISPADELGEQLTASPSAEHVALSDLYGEQLESALATLSPELRSVLEATVLDGMSVRETATWLGIPEATVKTRAFRARRHLRQALS